MRRFYARLAAAWLVVVLMFALYWTMLLSAHKAHLAEVEALTRQRAAQTAHALAREKAMQFRKVDFISQALSSRWVEAPERFTTYAGTVKRLLGGDALIEIALANADGDIVYSSLREAGAEVAPVSIADQEHFRVHLTPGAPRLYLSEPVFGRISKQWALQLSRAIRQEDTLLGVLVLSVSTEHLSAALHEVFPESRDVAVLARNDGAYLARSYRMGDVLGKSVPEDVDFLKAPARIHGTYELVAPVDGIERIHAWHRVPGYPALVSLGLDKDKALGPVRSTIEGSFQRNAIASLLLLLALVVLTRSRLQAARQAAALAETHEKLDLALRASRLGVWDWHCASGVVRFNAEWGAMLGYGDERPVESLSTWAGHVHPEDLPAVRAALDAHLGGGSPAFEVEYRMRHRSGRWIWVHDRGQVMERAPDGKALRVAGTIKDVSDRVADAQLRRALLEKSAAAIALVDGDYRVIDSNARAREIFLEDGADGRIDVRGLRADEAQWEQAAALFRTLRSEGLVRFRLPLRDRLGAARWFDIQGVALDPQERHGEVVWTLIDITEAHRNESALRLEQRRLAALLEHFPAGVLLEDVLGVVQMVNPQFGALLDLEMPAEALMGQEHETLAALLGPDNDVWLRLADPERRGDQRRVVEVETAGGRMLEVAWVPIEQDGALRGQFWILADVSVRNRRERVLAEQAATDPLTGLLNRRSFLLSLEDAVRSALAEAPVGRPGALLILDIDHFKAVNDRYGHPVGDRVIQAVAGILRDGLRSGDVCGRWGGEEFVALLRRCTRDDAQALAERLRQAVEAVVVETDQGAVRVTASIGCAMLDLGLVDTVIAQADAALYAAKHGGRNRVCQRP